MTKKMWEFRVDGVKHKVEIEHGYMSRKLSAVIDWGSKPIQFPKNQEPFDLGSKNHFQLANHTCAVVIIPHAFKYEYDLEVDGVSIVTGKSNDMQEIRSRQLKTASRQAGIFILLMGLILGWVNWNLAHTKGYFYEEVAYFTPFFIFLPIYFMLFPKEFVDQYDHKQKLSAKMWIVVIIFMLVGFAHAYLLGHGFY